MAEAIGGREIQLLDGHAFRNAVHSLMAAPRATFVVVMLRPGDRGSSHTLARLALQSLPLREGDFSGAFDDAVWLCMRDARAKNVAEPLANLQDVWLQTHAGGLVARSASYPGQESAVTTLLSAADSGPVSTFDLLAAEESEKESVQFTQLELEPDD